MNGRTDCGLSLVHMESEDAHDEEGDTTDDHVRDIPHIAAASQRWPTFDIDPNGCGVRVLQSQATICG
jgi:hypothetical protein